MSLKQAILLLHEVLSKAGIDHALIGGFALAVHGINRATGDIDLLVDEGDRKKLVSTLAAEGFKARLETPEVIHFEGPVRLDVLFARRPMAREMMGRAKALVPLPVKCLDAEDLIGLKIQAYCNNPKRVLQDRADIQFLIGRYPNLDWRRVKTYADLFNQWEEIEKLR